MSRLFWELRQSRPYWEMISQGVPTHQEDAGHLTSGSLLGRSVGGTNGHVRFDGPGGEGDGAGSTHRAQSVEGSRRPSAKTKMVQPERPDASKKQEQDGVVQAVETADKPDALVRACGLDLAPQGGQPLDPPLGLPDFPAFPNAPIPSKLPQLLPPPMLGQHTAYTSPGEGEILSGVGVMGGGNVVASGARPAAISIGGFALGATAGLLLVNGLLWYSSKRRSRRREAASRTGMQHGRELPPI